MLATDVTPSLTPQLTRVIESTRASNIAIHDRADSSVLEQWNRLVDRLIELAQHQSRVDEDGLEWPQMASLSACFDLLCVLREKTLPLPDAVLPDGSGGVTLERREGRVAERFELSSDGCAEYFLFVDSQLKVRTRVPLEFQAA